MHPTGDQLPLSLMTFRETYLPDSLSLHGSISQPQPLPSFFNYITSNSLISPPWFLPLPMFCTRIAPFPAVTYFSSIIWSLAHSLSNSICATTPLSSIFHFTHTWLLPSPLLLVLSFQASANAFFPLAKSQGEKTVLIIRKLTPSSKYAGLWTTNGSCQCCTADRMPKFSLQVRAEALVALSNVTNSP